MKKTLRRVITVAALSAIAAGVLPAGSAFAELDTAPRYSGALGQVLRTAGLEDDPQLYIVQGAVPGVPQVLASHFTVATSNGPATLVSLDLPATQADDVFHTAWILTTATGETSAWAASQLDGTRDVVLQPRAVNVAGGPLSGCDIAGEIVGAVLKSIPGAGLFFEAACNSSSAPQGGVRWAWYDPIFPQSPADYYDRQAAPAVGDGPVYQVFDVHYKSHRCYDKEALAALSRIPNFGYRGPLDACIWIAGSEPHAGRYVAITARYSTVVRWIDGIRQTVSFSTTRNDTPAPYVYHTNYGMPLGKYTSSALTREYWPESPSAPAYGGGYIDVGQVKEHWTVVPNF